jgi:hypothetical protein
MSPFPSSFSLSLSFFFFIPSFSLFFSTVGRVRLFYIRRDNLSEREREGESIISLYQKEKKREKYLKNYDICQNEYLNQAIIISLPN